MVENLPDAPASGLMLAAALAHVPGYTGDPSAEVTALPGGSLNRSYRVLTRAGRFVARLSPGPDAWLAADRAAERELHRAAAAAGIAPRIIHADEQWLITEFIAGRSWTSMDFGDPGRLERLGCTLRRLHELAPPQSGRIDLLRALQSYVRRIQVVAPETPQLEVFLGEARGAWSVSGAADRPVAIVHHDLHGSNLIDARGGLMLIDWECAAVADPLLDVACILSYHETARAHAPLLLKHSGLGTISPAQLAATVWLFDLHTYLWYRERRQRLVPSGAELEAEQRVLNRVTGALGVESAH
jgi:aminoglycoside phosphotransferase (APT) family kinase protein